MTGIGIGMSAPMQPKEGRRSRLLLSLGIAGLGVFVGVETASIPIAPSYARIGPTFFPWIIGGGLVVTGLTLAWQAVSGGWAVDDTSGAQPEAIDGWALGFVALGLAVQAALMVDGGFILASTLLFCFATRAFGSRRIGSDIVIALVLTAITYGVFTFGLGLQLPAGLLARIF